MVRRLSAVWCWRCDGETPHQAHVHEDAVTMVCEECGSDWTLRPEPSGERADFGKAAPRRG